MSFEASFFKKKTVQKDKLRPFGFVEESDDLVYRQVFLDGQFEAILRVSKDGHLSGQVLDLDLGDDYTAFRDSHAQGPFIGLVREEYAKVLKNVAEQCFRPQLFHQKQTNRLAHYVMATFNDPMDQPFDKLPTFTAFRHPANRKWYGLVGLIKREKLHNGKGNGTPEEFQEELEMINIKVSPKELPKRLKLPGIYPAYHMSKKSWVTILLDDSLSDETLFALVKESRDLVSPKTVVNANGPNYWIIPANPKHYNINAAFAKSSELSWRHKASIAAGDWVLIYMTSPIQAVRYICQVTAIFPSENTSQKSSSMQLSLVTTLSDNQLPLALLQEKEVKAVRGPRRATQALVDYLQEQKILTS